MDPDQPLSAMEDASLYADPNARNAVLSVFSMQLAEESSDLKDGFKVIGKLSVPLSLAWEGILVFQLDSTSMEPHLRKGAHVGVDKTQKRVVSGELYAVRIPYEGISIKYVFPDIAKSQAVLRAENPQHPEIAIPLESIGDAILGRVVWAINRY